MQVLSSHPEAIGLLLRFTAALRLSNKREQRISILIRNRKLELAGSAAFLLPPRLLSTFRYEWVKAGLEKQQMAGVGALCRQLRLPVKPEASTMVSWTLQLSNSQKACTRTLVRTLGREHNPNSNTTMATVTLAFWILGCLLDSLSLSWRFLMNPGLQKAMRPKTSRR